MKKRVLSLFLCFVLCISMVPTAILAEEASAEEMQGSGVSEEAQTEEMNGLSTSQDIEDVQSSDNDEQADADMQADNASVICTAELAAVGSIVQDSGEQTLDEAVRAVQASIDALPTADTVTAADYDTVQAAYDAYEALTDEQQALIVGADVFEELYAWFNGQLQTIDEEYVVCVFDGNTQIQEYADLSDAVAAAQSCDDPIIKIWGSAGSEFEIRLFDSDLPDGAKNMTIDLNGHQIEDISFYLTSNVTIYITDSVGGGRAETLSAGSANVKLSGGSYWRLKVGSGRSVAELLDTDCCLWYGKSKYNNPSGELLGGYTDQYRNHSYFEVVEQKAITADMVTVDTTKDASGRYSYVYTGDNIENNITVKDGDYVLIRRTSGNTYDYEVKSGSGATDAGEHRFHIEANPSGKKYTGDVWITWVIEQQRVENARIDVAARGRHLQNGAATPEITVYDNNGKVIPSTEYTVNYSNNTAIGSTAVIEVVNAEGGNYIVNGQTTFTVIDNDISHAVITFEKELVYTGEGQLPTIESVVLSGSELELDTDYYIDDTVTEKCDAGTYIFKIIGKGIYEGSAATKEWTIAPVQGTIGVDGWTAELDPDDSTVLTYDGSEKKPAIIVKDPSGKEIPSSEYSLEYSNNINAGKATITVKDSIDSGNYYIQGSTTFDIEKAVPQYTVPTGLSSICGNKLSTVRFEDSHWSWNNGDQSIVEAGNPTFKATYTPDDTSNYKIVQDIDVPVAVKALELEFILTGPCDQENTATFDIGARLPQGTKVTSFLEVTDDILKSCMPAYSAAQANYATLSMTTRILEEPQQKDLICTVRTDSAGDVKVTVKVNLTGKYIVTINAHPSSALYDGNIHAGYRDVTTSLTAYGDNAYPNGYQGGFTYTYYSGQTKLTGAPSAIGRYSVTIAVPEDNASFKGSTTIDFSIISEPEAEYQSEADGSWIRSSFDDAVAYVYEGGTVRLLTDVTLVKYFKLDKNITITSSNAEQPCRIQMMHDEHGYILDIEEGADVTLTDVIVDGGYESGAKAVRAAIIVAGGKLTLGSGAVIQNNYNAYHKELTLASGTILYYGGDGGGIYMSSGSITMESGSTIRNNTVNNGQSGRDATQGYGGGISISSGTFTMNGGSITSNSAIKNGGGLMVYHGTINIGGGEITKNNAGNVGGAIMIDVGVTLNLTGGRITENSTDNFAGGIECSPESITNISGSPIVKDNTSNEEKSGGVYSDGAKPGNTYPNGYYATINIGELADGADIHFFTWMEEINFLMSKHADNYTIQTSDMDKMTYDGSYYLKLNSDGNVVLAAKVTADYIPPVASSQLTYNGTAQPLMSAVQTSDGIPMYRLKADDVSRVVNAWSETIPTAIYPGEYTVEYYIKGDKTHLDSDVNSLPVIMNKAKATVTALGKKAYVSASAPDLSAPVIGSDYTISGILEGDVLDDTVSITLSYAADLNMSEAGTYDIIPSVVGEDSCYDFEFVNGALAVSKKSSHKPSNSGTIIEPETPTTPADEDAVNPGENPANQDELDAPNNTGTDTPGSGFIDVPDDSYFKEPVDWAVDKNITTGTGHRTFTPDGVCTRAQAVTFLHRAAGNPDAVTKDMPFEDVADDSYYYEADLWAVENGITKGTSETTFSPDASCTRAQIVTLLWRALNMPEAEAAVPFNDVDADAYYIDAVLWAVENGITQGTSETTFSPDDYCTRSQIVTFIYRALAEQ